MSKYNEKYRECRDYENALKAVRKSKEGLWKVDYQDPGLEIMLERRRKMDPMNSCTCAIFSMLDDDEGCPCLDCPIGAFRTAPKLTPFLTETTHLWNTLYANTCHEFGLGTGEIITNGQVWTLTDNINRIVQAAAIIAAVKESGGRNVIIFTDPYDNDDWIHEIERFAELFGRVRFVAADELEDEEPDDELRVVFVDMDYYDDVKDHLNMDWDLMIVDHARSFTDPKRNDQVYQIGKKAFFRLIIASGRREDRPRDWFWIYRLADERIFGDDYNAYLKKYFNHPGCFADQPDEDLCFRLSSIGYFLTELDEDDPFLEPDFSTEGNGRKESRP